jgi:predicted flavoprotein YhiN
LRSTDVVIIGAGAAGLMCALTAANRGRKVMLIDHANKAGKKILMSGGGRCNFTNMYTEPNNFLSQNPHFCKSALARYTQWDFIEMVAKHGVPYHEKKLGQLFCDNKSSDILEMLLDECKQAGVSLHLDTSVEQIEKTDNGYSLNTTLARLTASRWWSPPAGCRSRPWAPRGLVIKSPNSSATPCCQPAQAWCRSPSPISLRTSAPSCQARRWIAW